MPLVPLAPEFDDETTIVPLLVCVPSPLLMDIDPPVALVLLPEHRVSLPPMPLVPLPTVIETAPPLPAVAAPEPR
jgi:hypothetical protein